MQIFRVSPLTLQMNCREIDCTADQLSAWKNGALIQNAMPHLSTDDREFLMTGYTPEDWAKIEADDLDTEGGSD